MSRLWAKHYAEGNITALFIQHHSPVAEELRIIENLEDATCVLVIGSNDPRRLEGNLDCPHYTAVRRELAPLWVRKSGMRFLTVVDRKTREPLTGGLARTVWNNQRAEFDIPDADEGQENAA